MLGFSMLSALYIAVFLWQFPAGHEDIAIVGGFVVAAISIVVSKLMRIHH